MLVSPCAWIPGRMMTTGDHAARLNRIANLAADWRTQLKTRKGRHIDCCGPCCGGMLEELTRELTAALEDKPEPTPITGPCVVLTDTGQKQYIQGSVDIADAQSMGWTFVCEKPHEDGDFSYLCGFRFCRCSS